MTLGRFEKDVDETIDYVIDWSKRLNGDTLTSASHSVSPSGLSIDSESNTSTASTVRLSGGTAGIEYKVEVSATSSDGETVQHEFYVTAVER